LLGSNESGKSTILEAATWCLFGGEASRGTKAGIRWHGAPARKTASVELGFEIGGRRLSVFRDENDAVLREMDADGTASIIAKGVAAVNKLVPQVLGLSYNEFCASFFVRQKDVSRLATMLPTERVAFIRSLMGMSKIDDALKACRARKSALSQERDGLMMGLGERAPLEGALAHAERYLASTRVNVGVASVALSGLGVAHAAAQTALKAAKARKDAHEHHARALVQAKLAREAARLEVSRLDAKLALMDGARQRIAAGEVELAAVPGLREERDKLMLCKQHVVEHMVLTAQANKLAAEIKMAQDGIKAAAHDIGLYDEAADRHTGTAMVAVKERLDGLKQARVGRRSAIQARIGGTEGARDIIRTKLDVLEDAGQEGACPTCGRVLMDCYQDVCDEMRDELAAIDATLGDLRLALGKQGLPSEEEVHAAASLEVATAEVRRHTQLAVNASRAQVATEHSKVALARAEKALEDVNARLAQIPDFAYDPTELERVEADLTRLDLLDRELVGDRALLAQETEARGLLEERHKMLDDAKAAIATAEWGIADSGYEPVDFAETERGAESARKAAEDGSGALGRRPSPPQTPWPPTTGGRCG
jgi:exonuclease SbcC